MRKSKTPAAQIEATERAEADRVNARKDGFSLMEVRDRGWGRVYEKNGNNAVMVWGVKDELAAANLFKLVINRKEYVFDAEEFRKFLRWA